MDVISYDVNALVERLQLPTLHQHLMESLISATTTPSAENILRLQQHLIATENAYNVAISTAHQTLSCEPTIFFVTTVYPCCVLIEESRRYLETLLPIMRLSPTPTSGKTETPKAGIDGSDREGEGESVDIIGSGSRGGRDRGLEGGNESGNNGKGQHLDVKDNVKLLEERFHLPALLQQLIDSLSSAKKTPSAENLRRYRQSLAATEHAYDDAFLHLKKMDLNKDVRIMVWNSVAKPFGDLLSEKDEFLQKPTPSSSPVSTPVTSPSIAVDTKALEGLDCESLSDGGSDRGGVEMGDESDVGF